MYPRLMLKHRHGYPLYGPEPPENLPIQYRKKGVRIGDVGTITPDGAFDFLFNVDSSQADSINPHTLPSDFETIPPIESLSDDYFPPGEHLLSDYVEQTREELVLLLKSENCPNIYPQPCRVQIPSARGGGPPVTGRCQHLRSAELQEPP